MRQNADGAKGEEAIHTPQEILIMNSNFSFLFSLNTLNVKRQRSTKHISEDQWQTVAIRSNYK